MGKISISIYGDSELVVDSRLIAKELEINHSENVFEKI
jgi:hypothetical protein